MQQDERLQWIKRKVISSQKRSGFAAREKQAILSSFSVGGVLQEDYQWAVQKLLCFRPRSVGLFRSLQTQ